MPMVELTLYLAQINPLVGDIDGNRDRILDAWKKAGEEGADLVIFPELVTTGYPPEDLINKPVFVERAEDCVRELAAVTGQGGSAMLISSPVATTNKPKNALHLIKDGAVEAVRYKHHLPNYGVFDEKRVFDEGDMPDPVAFKGLQLGLLTCEDIWFPDVAAHLKEKGAQILIAPHGSPYEVDKLDARKAHASNRAKETGLPVIFVNQVGGQDELIFDGTSFAYAPDGKMVARLKSFEEDSLLLKVATKDAGPLQIHPARTEKTLIHTDAIYRALTLGLRDYVEKNKFPGVIIGLSGGVDSALTAAIAVDALGPKRVLTVMMPSVYTSKQSLDDAKACADFLGVAHRTIPIHAIVDAFDASLSPHFKGLHPDTTEENIQARIRGIILMALSNKFGEMVVATGNKSEFSVGYSTLYGDLCGGFALLKDTYKTTVYELCRWRNENKPEGGLGPKGYVMPDSVITKAPTAELREDQKDEDSLPPYAILDGILNLLIEEDLSLDDIVAKGYERDTVARVERMLYLAEYKRRQAPPGVKITSRQFGRDRRYPITNRFRSAT